MSPIVEQPRQTPAEPFESLPPTLPLADVPGMMADRIGVLYAEEERRERLARTERLIREAEGLRERAEQLGVRSRASDTFGELHS